jgi:hypothetical protein
MRYIYERKSMEMDLQPARRLALIEAWTAYCNYSFLDGAIAHIAKMVANT